MATKWQILLTAKILIPVFKTLQKEAWSLTLDIKYFPMRFSPESLEIKAVISRNIFLFKVIKSYLGAF